MAQETSELWKKLLEERNTEIEYAFEIDGKWYGNTTEIEHSVESGLYDDFGFGNAYIATLTIKLYADNIGKKAKIQRFARLKNGTQATEWLPKGVYFANRRAEEDGYWTVEAVDALRKSEVIWMPDQSLVFPMPMVTAVNLFCKIMGVELDPRTKLNPNYTIDYPANDYTLRDELCFIAAAHGGNWIMTDAGKLRLVTMWDLPPETNYLVSERGYAITFGGDRILV